MLGIAYLKAGLRNWHGSERTPPDLFRAIGCFMVAKEYGIGCAVPMLHDMLKEVDECDDMFIPLLRHAASLKDASSCWDLGEYLGTGSVCEKNVEESVEMFLFAQDYAACDRTEFCFDLINETEFFSAFRDHFDFVLFLARPPPGCRIPRDRLSFLVDGIRENGCGNSILSAVEKNYEIDKLRHLSISGRVTVDKDASDGGGVLWHVVFGLNDSLFKTFQDVYFG